MKFKATLNVDIRQKTGPEIADPQHIANWLVSESAEIGVGYGYLTLLVCPVHPDPSDCGGDCVAPDSKFVIEFDSVGGIQPA